MTQSETRLSQNAPISERSYASRVPETKEAIEGLSVESQAGLRQYSLERFLGYGLDYSDAVELRSMVLSGIAWKAAATELAERCMSKMQGSPASNITLMRRASALLRMSQAMMLTDTPERAEIFQRATDLYGQAAKLAGNCKPVQIETNDGPICGWLHPSVGQPVGSVIVIGGVEGWAMDFACMGDALAARGINALMLDGPGQGETRYAHEHYLTKDWRHAFERVIDYLAARRPSTPIGFIGNSMGGSFAMAVANEDKRIVACVNNGGPFAPWLVPQEGAFFKKMMALANVKTAEAAVDIWSTVTPISPGSNADYPLLMVHGSEDPLIANEVAMMLWERSPTPNKEMVTFSDGDHCIYRHLSDRDILVSDWMRERLVGAGQTQSFYK